MNSVRCLKAPIAATLVAVSWATIAFAGANPYFTLPLHAKAATFEPCTGYLPVDCRNVYPAVDVNLDTGALAVLGRMSFVAMSGCLYQTQSAFPLGIHAIDCAGGIDQIHPGEDYRLGRICVGQGGYAPCFVMPAVEAATWGSIKAQYE